MGFDLVLTSILLGVGLAMDAFSVSLADGLNENKMPVSRAVTIAGTFAAFQFLMPVIGWILVRTAVEQFGALEMFIPWIALILLLYIGGKMLIEGLRDRRSARADSGDQETADGEASQLSVKDLMIQGVATSIDALSVGFAIEHLTLPAAVGSALIIGVVTLFICLGGLELGKKIGTKLSGSASILGGVILIAIGLEIWVRGVFL